MKKKIIAILISLMVIFGGFTLFACGETDSDRILVYTSFYPIYDFATKIGGEKVEVVNLAKPGEEAHHMEISSSQMVGMEKADLIIISGLNMEGWVSDLSASLTSKLVNTSNSIQAIERTAHDEDEEEEEEHEHGAYDPHIWLSIKNAKKQMENIKNALVNIDSQNASYYEMNYLRYSYLFDGLDEQFETALSTIADRSFIVSHNAFGYLANDYNLTTYALTGIEDTGEPDTRTVADIIDFINQNDIKAVFYQTMANSSVAQSIVDQTTAELYPLSTLESLTNEEIATGEDYLSIMAKNLACLSEALS